MTANIGATASAQPRKYLVTGGAGYVGSVVAAHLLREGHAVTVLDDLSTGFRQSVPGGAEFIEGRIQDAARWLDSSYDGVLHFAAHSQVGESVKDPGKYWRNNVGGTIELLAAMRDAGVRRLVFSSTAATYGEPEASPIREDAPEAPTNPYGASKLAVDHMITGECRAHGLAAASLRYFNVAGAYGSYGERHDPESHLIPLVLQVAQGRREAVSVYGDDYPTPDGTCVRDYIHVADLADAHLLAMSAMHDGGDGGEGGVAPGDHLVCNLGNGNGFSVREVIETVRKVTGHPVPEIAAPRRDGDPATLVASAERAQRRLGWRPARTDLAGIVADAWEFAQGGAGHEAVAEQSALYGMSGADVGDGVQDVADGFAGVYGARPEGVWTAPGRVNLIGEHTDYNDGFVMPLALPHTCHVAAVRRDDGVLRLHSAEAQGGGVVELRADALDPQGAAGGDRGGWAAYPAGVLWALRAEGHQLGGADLYFSSTVPTGAGLSSSAALEVSTALALNDLYGLGLPPHRLATTGQRAENAFVGVPCGVMDQMASACCTAGHALHLDTRDLTQRQVPFDLAARGLRLLVVDTQVKHALGDGEYAKRRAGCEAGAAALGVTALRDVSPEGLDEALGRLDDPQVRALVRHVVTENARVEETIGLLDAGETRAIGPVLTAGHASLRDDFRVSCAELDLVVDTAEEAGALGARMTGGGFGGSAVVLVETDAAEGVGKAVNSAFATAGYRAPRLFEAVPGEGARRVA